MGCGQYLRAYVSTSEGIPDHTRISTQTTHISTQKNDARRPCRRKGPRLSAASIENTRCSFSTWYQKS